MSDVTAEVEDQDPEDEEDELHGPQVEGMAQQLRIPLPAVPLPMTFVFGIVPIGEGRGALLATAMNESGSMTQGFLSVDQGSKIGRDMLKACRNLDAQNSRSKLFVPGGAGRLVVPA
jgi:hypothetical protein